MMNNSNNLLTRMLKKFFNSFRPTKSQTSLTAEDKPTDGWHSPLSADKLLDTPLRQQYLNTIWQNVSMAPDMFKKLYRTPIEHYAEMVQLLPASESHHHAHIGGMLDHGLEVISIAARLRQSYVLPPNAAPEEQAKQRDVWTAVVIYAALLHDIGKVAVDIEVQQKDGSRWFPWQGKPTQPYNFRYIKGRDYTLHPTLGGFFASQMLPKEAFDWIGKFPQAFAQLMTFVSGHHDKAGILAEIIQKADQISVTMALGGDPAKLGEQPKMSFAKQLQIALRHVVGQFKLNAPKGGCDGWLTEDGLWLMSKSTADNIRGYLMSQGVSVPSQNGKLFDELQTHHLIEKTAQDTAIWNCKVASNIGWAPLKPFSLLKISPNVIWDNIEQRPALFEGCVNVVDEQGNPVSTDVAPTLLDVEVPNMMPDLSIADTANNVVPPTFEAEPVNDNLTTEPVVENPTQSLSEPTLDSIESTDDVAFALQFFDDMMPDTSEQNVEPEVEKSLLSLKATKETEPSALPTPPQKVAPKMAKNVKKEAKQTTCSPNSTEIIDGLAFLNWVKAGVLSGEIFVNKPNALIHIVQNHLFLVTPNSFQIYLRKAGVTDEAAWELLQKHFQNLGIHKRCHTENDSRNIWECSVVGPKRTSILNGFLIEDVKLILGDKLAVNNQWLTLKGDPHYG